MSGSLRVLRQIERKMEMGRSKSTSQTGKIRLSAAIIAKNEEKRIESTIKSVLTLVDHVYLMDFGSEDKTAKIAEKLGAKVYKISWNYDFSEIRNQLLEKIEEDGETDTVLWIEPGEMFDYRTAPEFREFAATTLERDTAYMMITRKYWIAPELTLPHLVVAFLQDESQTLNPLSPVDGFSDWNEESIEMRLIPVSPCVRFVGRLREMAIPALQSAGMKISASCGRILAALRALTHPERVTVAENHLAILKNAENSGLSLSEDELFAKADALVNLSDVVGGRNLYKNLIENARQGNLRLESYYNYYATFDVVPPIGNEAVEFLLQSLDVFPLDMQLLTNLGIAMFRQKNYEMAIRVFEIAVLHGKVSLDVLHKQCVQEIAIAHLSLIYRITGEQEKAIDLLEGTMNAEPTHSQLARLLIDLYVAQRAEEKLHQFVAHYWGDAELDAIREVFTGACRASGGAWRAALVSLENAYRSGCRDPYCLRWYSLCLLSNLRFAEACNILDEWLQVDPTNFEAKTFRFAASQPDRFSEILELVQKNQGAVLGIDLAENFDKLILSEEKPVAEPQPVAAETPPTFPGFDFFRFESPNSGNATELTFQVVSDK